MRDPNIPTSLDGPDTYQHIVVEGLPFDRGFSHGTQVSEKIKRNVKNYRKPGRLAGSKKLIEQIINDVYIPSTKQHYPSAFAEMEGIAAGADVSLQDVFLLNSRYDLARLYSSSHQAHGEEEDVANECTSAYFHPEASSTGEAICAQNWDMSARLLEEDCIIYLEVHPDPSEGKPSMFLVTEAGQLGRSGMNSNGMSLTANSLMSTGDFVPAAKCGPYMPISLLRRMILESTHLAQAFTAAYNFPRHVSNNITIGVAEGFGLCLEIHPDRIYKVYPQPGDNFVAHANHFTHPGFLARSDVSCRYPGGSSWFRQARFEKLIRPYTTTNSLSPKNLIAAFSDHMSCPESLCVHAEKHPRDADIRHLPGYPFRGISATVVCVVYNLTSQEVYVCKGPPCRGAFQTFQLRGSKTAEEKCVVNGNGMNGGQSDSDEDRPERP